LCGDAATAQAAERGGADRIELCENLRLRGDRERRCTARGAQRRTSADFAMVRPRGGDFVYSEAEFAQMARDLACVKACASMIGFRAAARGPRVDVRRQSSCRARVAIAVTFHRAFDEVPTRQLRRKMCRHGSQEF